MHINIFRFLTPFLFLSISRAEFRVTAQPVAAAHELPASAQTAHCTTRRLRVSSKRGWRIFFPHTASSVSRVCFGKPRNRCTTKFWTYIHTFFIVDFGNLPGLGEDSGSVLVMLMRRRCSVDTRLCPPCSHPAPCLLSSLPSLQGSLVCRFAIS